QVLVVKDRRRAAVLAEDVHHLPEELVARVLLLPQLVPRIVAVFADDQHRVHGQPSAPAAQGLGDARVDGEAELLGALPAEVIARRLIDIGRDALEGGPVPPALYGVAVQEAFGHVPGVRALAPLRGDDGHAPGPCRLRGPLGACRPDYSRADRVDK